MPRRVGGGVFITAARDARDVGVCARGGGFAEERVDWSPFDNWLKKTRLIFGPVTEVRFFDHVRPWPWAHPAFILSDSVSGRNGIRLEGIGERRLGKFRVGSNRISILKFGSSRVEFSFKFGVSLLALQQGVYERPVS